MVRLVSHLLSPLICLSYCLLLRCVHVQYKVSVHDDVSHSERSTAAAAAAVAAGATTAATGAGGGFAMRLLPSREIRELMQRSELHLVLGVVPLFSAV